MNDRQINLLNNLLDGFDGKLASSKWAAIGKCSQDTALRNISDLVERGILEKSEASGRSTSYEVMPMSPQPDRCRIHASLHREAPDRVAASLPLQARLVSVYSFFWCRTLENNKS